MKIKGKKAAYGLILKIFAISLGIIILLSLTGDGKKMADSFRKQGGSAFKISGGSNIPDIMNPCKCGWPTTEKYEQIEHESKVYCVHSKVECKQDDNLYQTINYTRIQGGTPIKMCVYLPSNCDK